jgi:predicted amidohydrolase
VKLALIQMTVTEDKRQNIAYAAARIRAQKQNGAQIAVLPEMFCCPYDTKYFMEYGESLGGEAQTALASLAGELGVYIVAGSIPEQDGDKLYNTSFVYGPDGTQVARHRKMHLFDINVDGGQYFRESDVLSAGSEVTVFDTPWGKFGLCICFDIRFSELSLLMALRGAQVVIVPGAFNMTTGPVHWELHFRARAVDNQVFTVGVAPARDGKSGYISYGHSIVCDPWGTILHDNGPGDCDAIVELDMTRIPAVRRQLPILSARRTSVYDSREVR